MNTLKKLSLNGQWKMINLENGKSYNAVVPTDTYTVLLNEKAIQNPYYKDNEKDVAWVGKTDFSFERKFNIDEDILKYRNIVLNAKALDTLCEIYINEQLIGKGVNAFLEYNFHIEKYVNVGENTIKIKFFAPTTYAEKMQKAEPLPKNNNGTDGIAYIRKPACHFGWDWGPHIPLSGITDSIQIVAYDSKILDVEISQDHRNKKVLVKINPIVEGEGKINSKIICPDGAEIPFKNNEVLIENPQLWWTKELSKKDEQPLYKVVTELNGDVFTKTIGLRTIKLNRENDEYGGNFCFYLNNVPIFAKGASFILPDSIMGRVKNDVYDYYIDSALSANFNMIRIWGGAYYGSDYFYEQCDKKGLLIWQDFMFACLMYPFYNEDFLNNVLKETEYQIRRIKSHPSLCLLCGNNEIETMFSYMPEKLKIVEWYKKFFYEILQNQTKKLAPQVPYIPTSPIGESFRKGVTGDKFGDTHMWNVWHGQKPLNYYRKRLTRFCSEFGLQSLPSVDAIKTFAEDKDLSITSDVFNSHQKCPNGNLKMLYYMYEKFYEPQNFEDLVYMTGLIQKECIADATEHWRRNRHRCHGSLFWQYNDCWQAPSWSSVDYLGKWKPLQYHAKHFFEPLTVSICENKKGFEIYAINDLMENQSVSISYKLMDLDGKILDSDTYNCKIKPCESSKICESRVNGDLENMVLYAYMEKNGVVVSEKTKIFVPDKYLKLKNSEIKKTITKTENGVEVTLLSKSFCRTVMVDIEGESTPFTDNYFDLLPNVPKTITLKTTKSISENDIKVKSLSQIPVNKDDKKSKLFRLKFALQPLNIGNWFWYSVN